MTQDKQPKTTKNAALSFDFAQINRQFDLIKTSNQRCLTEFPDCFHHKLKLRKECHTLLNGLFVALDEVKKGLTAEGLPKAQRSKLKASRLTLKYLINHLKDVVSNINELEASKEQSNEK